MDHGFVMIVKFFVHTVKPKAVGFQGLHMVEPGIGSFLVKPTANKGFAEHKDMQQIFLKILVILNRYT
jgi:hypothetical protein